MEEDYIEEVYREFSGNLGVIVFIILFIALALAFVFFGEPLTKWFTDIFNFFS